MPTKTTSKKAPAKATKKTAAKATSKASKAVVKKSSALPKNVAEFEDASKKPGAAATHIEKETAPKKQLGTYFYANGKRKTSVACVRVFKDGKGEITINDRTFENYFPVATDQDKVLTPLRVANVLKSFDITVKVFGGGIHSQAEAVRHGIAKALLEYDAAVRSILKPLGLLTRDSRVKERKKYGLKRARRAPQWQKR